METGVNGAIMCERGGMEANGVHSNANYNNSNRNNNNTYNDQEREFLSKSSKILFDV